MYSPSYGSPRRRINNELKIKKIKKKRGKRGVATGHTESTAGKYHSESTLERGQGCRVWDWRMRCASRRINLEISDVIEMPDVPQARLG